MCLLLFRLPGSSTPRPIDDMVALPIANVYICRGEFDFWTTEPAEIVTSGADVDEGFFVRFFLAEIDIIQHQLLTLYCFCFDIAD